MKVVVAGVAGGSGATTVAALLAHALTERMDAALALRDHSAGTLAARVGALGAGGGPQVELADLGPLTTPSRWEMFADAEAVPVLAASMTPAGMAAVADALALLGAHAPGARESLVLVACGAGRGDADWLALGRGEAADAARCVLPRDRALAQGGAVDLRRLGAGARRGMAAIADAVTARLEP